MDLISFFVILLAGTNAQSPVNRQQQPVQDVTTVETVPGSFNQGPARQSGGIPRFLYGIKLHHRKQHIFTPFLNLNYMSLTLLLLLSVAITCDLKYENS